MTFKTILVPFGGQDAEHKMQAEYKEMLKAA